MATNKPKLQGYVDRSLFGRFEIERQAWGLTQSQALDRILAERYRSNEELDNGQESFINKRLGLLEVEFKGMNALNLARFDQVFQRLAEIEKSIINNNSLEITSDIQGEPLEITSDSQGEPLVICSDTDSESLQITSDNQSEPLEITSDSQGEPPVICSDTDSESLEITSDSQGEPLEITSDSQGEPLEITSDSQGEPISASHPYFDRLLVCEIRKDGLVDYWGEDGGLTVDIRQAKLYEHKRYAEAQIRKLKVGLSPVVAENIKLATARSRLEAEIGINKIPYSLRQIFDYWEKQELRRISKRKSKGQRGKSEITE